MYSLLIFLIVVVCILLVFFVMVQKPKGGGLSSSFGGGGGGQIGGVKSTNDFLERTTWTLITALFIMVIGTNVYLKNNTTEEDPIGDKTKNIELPKQPETTPAPAGGETGQALPPEGAAE